MNGTTLPVVALLGPSVLAQGLTSGAVALLSFTELGTQCGRTLHGKKQSIFLSCSSFSASPSFLPGSSPSWRARFHRFHQAACLALKFQKLQGLTCKE